MLHSSGNKIGQNFKSRLSSRRTLHYFKKPTINTLRNKLSFAGVAALFVAIAGLAAWHASTAPESTRTSTVDNADTANASTIEIHTNAVDGVSQSGDQKMLDTGSSSENTSSASVAVNGDKISSPDSGSVNKTVKSDDGNLNVSIQSDNNSTTNKRSHSYQNVYVRSDSDSSSRMQINQQSTGVTH